jgi:glucokinase
MKKYCFGIDIGGTSIKCGVFDLEGTILEKWEIRTRTEDKGVHILPDIAETIFTKISERGIGKEEILGIGVGVPGPVNEEGELPTGAVNLHWKYKHLVKELHEMTGLQVKAGNDANVAALGEMFKGGGAGHADVILVTLGTGVGGGIIVNGQIVTGAHGAGGEIGHVRVERQETEACNCGNYGCLEQVASATGIVRLAKRILEASDTPSVLRSYETLSAKSVFDAVKAKDAAAMKVAEEFGYYLGSALSIFAGVVDPQIFVIGGGVSKAGTVILDYVRKYYKKYAFAACKETEFALAMLGNDAGIYGAAKLIIG